MPFAGRRPFFATLAAAMLGPTAALAQISDDVVKIGVLTGTFAPQAPAFRPEIGARRVCADMRVVLVRCPLPFDGLANDADRRAAT